MEHDTPALAGRGRRLLAVMIDGALSVALTMPVMFGLGVFTAERLMAGLTFSQQAYLFVFGFGVFLLLHSYLLYTRGQTIGKLAMGVKIVDSRGAVPAPVNLFLLRYLVPGLVSLIPIVGGLISLVDALFIFGEKRRCLHDLLAGTWVVKA